MLPFATRVAIDFAQGRASLYVRSDIGASSPGRWQFVQFLKKMGATSLVNVDEGALPTGVADCATSWIAPATHSAAAANVCRIVIQEAPL
jgi:hypothetical protein